MKNLSRQPEVLAAATIHHCRTVARKKTKLNNKGSDQHILDVLRDVDAVFSLGVVSHQLGVVARSRCWMKQKLALKASFLQQV